MNYKQEAAAQAVKLIKPNQSIGFGAGNTVELLIDILFSDQTLAQSLKIVTSSDVTKDKLVELGFNVLNSSELFRVDVYFDGCDQVDRYLNAFKSGGGIHTDEKALAAIADDFVLLGDEDKLKENLNVAYPLTIEILPSILNSVKKRILSDFNVENITVRKNKDGELLYTKRNGNLIDVWFNELPPLENLNQIKMWAGVIDHSLFYKMATTGIICGSEGLKILKN